MEAAAEQPRAGSLYRVIARLVDSRLVAESGAEPDVAHPGLARRYYTLTPEGALVLNQFRERWATFRSGVDRILGTECA